LRSLDFFAAEQDLKPEYDENGYQKIKSPHNNLKAKVFALAFFVYFWTLAACRVDD